MLDMIKPTSNLFYINRHQTESPLHTPIAGDDKKTSFSDLLSKVQSIVMKILDWIKSIVLFILFDPKEEQRKNLAQELKGFSTFYNSSFKKHTDKDEKAVVKKFKELPTELQKKVKQQMLANLKKEYPDHTDDSYETQVNEALSKNPFGSTENNNVPFIGRSVNQVIIELQ